MAPLFAEDHRAQLMRQPRAFRRQASDCEGRRLVPSTRRRRRLLFEIAAVAAGRLSLNAPDARQRGPVVARECSCSALCVVGGSAAVVAGDDHETNPHWLCTKRAIERARDLLTRPGTDRGRQRDAPAFGSPCGAFQPQIRQDSGLIDVNGDLFGTALGSDMLGAHQRRPAPITGKPDQID
jgi:hypothetical protein